LFLLRSQLKSQRLRLKSQKLKSQRPQSLSKFGASVCQFDKWRFAAPPPTAGASISEDGLNKIHRFHRAEIDLLVRSNTR
jgi:hypothetical protein